MSTKSVDQLIRSITAWLEPDDEQRALAGLRGWDADDWALARTVTFMHGVAPSLHQSISSTPALAAAIPAGFREYLEGQSALNFARMQRAHAELSAILAKANRMGIEVMPVKGSLLSALGQIDTRLRTMADIDLLIRPADQQAMARLLEGCGYQKEQPTTFYVHHDHYNRLQDRVVSWEGEHPENPLPVEVHMQMRRILWGDVFTPDYTPILWESSHPGEILGQRAQIPGDEAHYAYLCLHALVHFLVYKGRLALWLDLARLAHRIPDFSRLPDAGLLYPLIRLASRALPRGFAGMDLSAMAAQARPCLRNWAEHIPLNSRCGLINQRSPHPPLWIIDRWEYWRPTLVRLALAYPETPLPIAALAFLGRFVRHLMTRAINLLPAGEGRE